MIAAKIDPNATLICLVREPVVAFQRVEFGFAVAAPSEAYYAPISHLGGGNLDGDFAAKLAAAALTRMSDPNLRTLRPTAKPVPTKAVMAYVRDAFGPRADYSNSSGDHPAVIESETQVVIQAIEEFERPDLKGMVNRLKRDALSEAVTLIIDHAVTVRELAEVGQYDLFTIRLNLLQASQAMKSALALLLDP